MHVMTSLYGTIYISLLCHFTYYFFKVGVCAKTYLHVAHRVIG
jgi:hypothetical protein